MDMSPQINHFFKSYNLKVEAKLGKLLPGYQSYDLFVQHPTKIAQIEKLQRELGLLVKSNHLRIYTDMAAGCVRMDMYSELPKERVGMQAAEYFASLPANDPRAKEYFSANEDYCTVIGRTYDRVPIITNYIRDNHILISGASGSGKSSLIKHFINQVLFNSATPESTRNGYKDKYLDIIDTKKIDYDYVKKIEIKNKNNPFSQSDWLKIHRMAGTIAPPEYSRIKTIDNPSDALEHLRTVYESIKNSQQPGNGSHNHVLRLVVIDEYADLAMSAQGKQITEYVQKIVQIARAFRVFVILATQRPSSEIITHNIKSNFLTRIALRAASVYDSRLILGQAGAQDLRFKGEAIIKSETYDFVRFQTYLPN